MVGVEPLLFPAHFGHRTEPSSALSIAGVRPQHPNPLHPRHGQRSSQSLTQRHTHAPTAFLLLFNGAAVGDLVFASAVPTLVRQGYMVTLTIIVAAWLSRLPKWTTWIMLVALAMYDLVVVLASQGPLRMLVELASSGDDELPALVYESRPTVGPATSSSSYASAMGSVEMQTMADSGQAGGSQYDKVEQDEDASRAVVEMRDLGRVRLVR
jgi:presenilin 1